MADGKRLFMVDGKPFFVLGRHRIYMGGYSVHNEAEIELNFKTAKETHGNTVGMAVFWDRSNQRKVSSILPASIP